MIVTGHPLYSRDSKGKIRIWFMEQEGNRFRTVSGLVDGERVTTDWTIAKGKNTGKTNETTDIQQAAKEIEQKYKKQLKTGYFKDINQIDEMNYIEPMLAKKYTDYKNDINFSQGDWVINYKYNGARCILTKKGAFTRDGEQYMSIPHIEQQLKPFFDQHPNAVLDGELFNEQYRQQLNELIKLVRKTVHITPQDLERSKELVKYYVYDGYGFADSTEQTPYATRKIWINRYVTNIYSCVAQVPEYAIRSESELIERYEQIIAEGHEGIILRYKEMPYEHKRSKNLLKFKPEDDAEFQIVDIQEGTGNWGGKAKIITVKMPDGKIFNATFKGSMADASKCLQEKTKWIGKTVTVKYFGLTGLGTPNYAQFDYANCRPSTGKASLPNT